MNPYEILGVPTDANDREIKSAYRSAVQKHHPDKGGDGRQFDLIQKSYEILSNEVRRRIYDSSGYTEEIKTPDIESQLRAMFGQLIERGDYAGDIIGRCIENVKQQGHEIRREILVAESKKMHLREQIGRVENSEGESIFDQILNQKIGEIDTSLMMMESQKICYIEMESVLKHYKDRKAQPFAAPTGASGYTTGSTWTG